MKEKLFIKVATPQQILYTGPADSVSSINTMGPFDVLAEHANFITIIENQKIIVKNEGQKDLVYSFSQAIILNIQNKVFVYAELQSIQKNQTIFQTSLV